MLKYDLTQYQLDKHIFANIVILVDTRENANQHILSYFDKKKIEYKMRKLDYGDYGLVLKANKDFGIMSDLVLDFVVERKGSLEELSGNFTNDRARIEEEFWRGNGKMALVIENPSIDNIINHSYGTNYNEKSFLATLLTFYHRYGINFVFTEKANAGQIIFALLYYKLREVMK